jgi:F-type H+-transporting ATPase subunit d
LLLPRRDIQIAKAKETEAQIDVELKDLQATLANIQDARPFEDLTVRFHPPLPCLFREQTWLTTRWRWAFTCAMIDQPELQVEEVGQAHPRILETVENMVKKGKWTVPGYKEKFGDLSLM